MTNGQSEKKLDKLIRMALHEDVGAGDITSELTVPEDSRCTATLRAKQDGILSGISLFRRIFDHVEADIEDWQAADDASTFENKQVVARFKGLTRGVLTGERTALNFLQHLSGIATTTAMYVKATGEYQPRICDTRKTTPLLRDLEKAAVRDGGGYNHRHGLSDGILIKENHVQAAGGIGRAVALAKAGAHHLMNVEIEVRDLDECAQATDAGARVIMLDNMSLDDMATAVASGKDKGILFEASGNVTLARVGEIAVTGVHIISVGAITHSANAADLSLTITIDS
ncbi:MAG: carboxylating nicotinate-nucleotide diphosphorylase [Candidatus Hydrogenedentota bacterium]